MKIVRSFGLVLALALPSTAFASDCPCDKGCPCEKDCPCGDKCNCDDCPCDKCNHGE